MLCFMNHMTYDHSLFPRPIPSFFLCTHGFIHAKDLLLFFQYGKCIINKPMYVHNIQFFKICFTFIISSLHHRKLIPLVLV